MGDIPFAMPGFLASSKNQPCAKFKPRPVCSTSNSALIQLICRTTPVPEKMVSNIFPSCSDLKLHLYKTCKVIPPLYISNLIQREHGQVSDLATYLDICT